METFVQILSVTATVSTIGLFLCGFSICQRIRQRGSTDGTSIAPFFLTCIGCACMFGYGWTRHDMTVKFVNGVGFAFQIVYLLYYYIHTRIKVGFISLRMPFTFNFIAKNQQVYCPGGGGLCHNILVCQQRSPIGRKTEYSGIHLHGS